MKRGMQWLFDYLVKLYFIYFPLHVEKFLFNCNFDFCYQWWQIVKWNMVLFTKKSRCGWVMMNKWFIMSGLTYNENFPKIIYLKISIILYSDIFGLNNMVFLISWKKIFSMHITCLVLFWYHFASIPWSICQKSI